MRRGTALATPLHQRAACTPMQCALAWLLMLAVLFGQGLGAVHTISHGVPGAGGTAHAHLHGHAHAVADALPAPHAHGTDCDHGNAQAVQALFGHAQDEPGCRLYDQLLQAGPLMPVQTVLALPQRTSTPQSPTVGVQLAATAAGYLARGPPRA